ncbi:hypothetical protein [Nostoc sp. TCL26-01]|uniref:hypothetical protein n=1 Tax=Nostoc sp. TCL26-01 TaxID=2576904 RepID=UPI0015BE5E9A|nr:hypothetical protein [Nostoc sp. TCL26-01]
MSSIKLYPELYNHKHSSNLYPLVITTNVVMVVDIIINHSPLSCLTFALTTLGTAVIIWRRELNGLLNFVTKLNRRYKFTTPALITLGTFSLLDALSTPAKAQFFQNAQTWMTSNFSGAGEAIPLVFNVLRGLFLIYLGISLVRVIQSARQDEDWQNLARTPMIILIAVTVGDILANLIIGSGGTTT